MTAKLWSYLTGQGRLLTSRGLSADLDSYGNDEVALSQVAPIVGLLERLQNSRGAKIHRAFVFSPSQTNPSFCTPEPALQPLFFANRNDRAARTMATLTSIPSESSDFDMKVDEHYGRSVDGPVCGSAGQQHSRRTKHPLDMGTFEALAIFFLSGC